MIIRTKYFETIIGALSFVVSGMVTWHVFTIGMMKALVDQNSHLNLSRQFFDSLTPGLSQIGFWPPLLHIFMAPVVIFDPMYHSGLGGYIILAPSLAAASIFLYRICLLLTRHHLFSFWGAVLFIFNPFILYYTATPMMEVLYMAFLFGSAYFLLKWIEDQKLKTLIIAGILVSLTTVSRFEGLFLIPISIAIVLLYQFKKKKSYHEIEALGIIFGILGILGVVFIFTYGQIYGGSIMSFANSQWSAFNQQRDYLLPTEHNVVNSFIYLIHASYHVIGKPVVLFAFISLFIWGAVEMAKRWQKFMNRRLHRNSNDTEVAHQRGEHTLKVLGTLAILGSPFLFDLVALIRGNAIIYVPELLPYGVFFNERYGLYWIGFVIVGIVLAVDLLHTYAKTIRIGYRFNLFFISCIVSFLFIWTTGWMFEEVYVNNYRLVKDSAQGYPSHDQAEVANYLRTHYDGGKVFMTRALHDFIAVEAHVPLREFIHESNYKYFSQVLERPWLFTRWVVMYNPGSEINGNWAKFNEKISGRYGHSDEFHKYYKKVVENSRERLYVLRPEAVATYASAKDYSIKSIPSLNPEIKKWNPDTIYSELTNSSFKIEEVPKNLMTSELIIASQFAPFYTIELQSNFINGYAANKGKESSELQSYALMQAYFAGDETAFDGIWKFTRTYIQHENDNLFSSEFTVDPKKNEVTLTNEASSTAADTDIAFVLYRAAKLWKNPSYTRDANLIVGDLWNEKVSSVAGTLVISSDTGQENLGLINIRTAAIKPYAYREFAKHDKRRNWAKLADDSYKILNRISGKEYRANTNVFLPPQGAVLNIATNNFELPEVNYYSNNFDEDAYQIYWNVALDVVLNSNKAAKDYLFVTNIFDEEWKKGSICSMVTFTAQKHSCNYDLESLTAPLAVWTVKNKKFADELISEYYLEKGKPSIRKSDSFKQKSWYWFGLMLWLGKI